MGNELKKKYGLITAICMVVGIVIGSGVFFKAEKILTATSGSMGLSIAAWVIGGLIMIVCAYTFSLLANKYEKVNGIVDYSENALGSKYGYFVGWFMSIIYYPTLTVALAWLCARYTGVLVGWANPVCGPEVMLLTGGFLILSYSINTLSPIIAGKVQVGCTFIKLVPLLIMGIGGLIWGLVKGYTVENFTHTVGSILVNAGTEAEYTLFYTSSAAVASPAKALFTAVCATAFAYEGWIIATSINSELKNSKRNLPIALVVGSLIIVLIYVLYYIGLAGTTLNKDMTAGGEAGAKLAFSNLLGKVGGPILFAFVIVSCFGTLNGLMLGCTRGLYAIAARNMGPSPETFSQVDKKTNMPTNASIIGLLLCIVWFIFFYGCFFAAKPWFGKYSFDMTELPIVTIYALYIPIFVVMFIRGIKGGKDSAKSFGSIFNNFVAPVLAVCGCAFMIVACCFSHKMGVVWYLIAFAVIMAIGAAFLFLGKKKTGVAVDVKADALTEATVVTEEKAAGEEVDA